MGRISYLKGLLLITQKLTGDWVLFQQRVIDIVETQTQGKKEGEEWAAVSSKDFSSSSCDHIRKEDTALKHYYGSPLYLLSA